MSLECGNNEREYESVQAFVQDVFNAPMLPCHKSKTGLCRFRFNAGDTYMCAMGYPDGNYAMCLKYLSWPDHETNRKWRFN